MGKIYDIKKLSHKRMETIPHRPSFPMLIHIYTSIKQLLVLALSVNTHNKNVEINSYIFITINPCFLLYIAVNVLP